MAFSLVLKSFKYKYQFISAHQSLEKLDKRRRGNALHVRQSKEKHQEHTVGGTKITPLVQRRLPTPLISLAVT